MKHPNEVAPTLMGDNFYARQKVGDKKEFGEN
jgi:hypothetical protein